MKFVTPILMLCLFSFTATAQSDPEFPKEFIMHIKLHNGMVTGSTKGKLLPMILLQEFLRRISPGHKLFEMGTKPIRSCSAACPAADLIGFAAYRLYYFNLITLILSSIAWLISPFILSL